MMNSLTVSWVVFACVFAGTLLGIYFRASLPRQHLNEDSKDLVKMGMGLIATMAALVLGLLIASAKNSYDTQRSGLVQMSANIMMLDRVLAHYGPETKEVRELLRREVASTLEQIWPEGGAQPGNLEPMPGVGETFYDKLHSLVPQNDNQRSLQTIALGIAVDIAKTRYLMLEQRGNSIPMPVMAIMVFWLVILFVSFGLWAPPNATVFVTLLVCALSVAGAVFLILELDRPFAGLIRISGDPLRNALAHLGL